MKIRTIWYQYPESYPGQLMPNLMDAADEYLDDDNPTYFQDKIVDAERLLSTGDISAFEIIVLEVDEESITDAFEPLVVKAKVKT